MLSASDEARKCLGLPRPVFVRILPFAVYVLFLLLDPVLRDILAVVASGFDLRWIYALRITAVLAVLAIFWKDYIELRTLGSGWLKRALAIASGVFVFVVWINLDQGWSTIGSPGAGFVALDQQGNRAWLMIAVRLFGASLVVPVMEELFWRSFLQRWIDRQQFLSFAPRSGSIRTLLITSVFFGFEHHQWAAGVIAGLVYGGLYRQTGNLWLAVAAHAVTNFLLGCWVVYSGQWRFW